MSALDHAAVAAFRPGAAPAGFRTDQDLVRPGPYCAATTAPAVASCCLPLPPGATNEEPVFAPARPSETALREFGLRFDGFFAEATFDLRHGSSIRLTV